MAAKTKYLLELKSGYNGAQFQAHDRHVELTEESPSFETTDQNLYAGLSELPFLKGTVVKPETSKASAEKAA